MFDLKQKNNSDEVTLKPSIVATLYQQHYNGDPIVVHFGWKLCLRYRMCRVLHP